MAKQMDLVDEVDDINDHGEQSNISDGQPDKPSEKPDRGDVVTEDEPVRLEEDDKGEAQKPKEGEAEEGAEKGGDKRRDNSWITAKRFNEVNEEKNHYKKVAETLMAQLGQKAPEPKPEEPAFDLQAKEEEAANALLDGDAKKHAALQAEIKQWVLDQATERARVKVEADQEQKAFTATAAQIKSAHPILDENSDEANPEAIDMVIALRNSLVAQGKPMHNALAEAAQRVVKLFKPVEPPPPPRPSIDNVNPRTVDQRAANARAAAAQPERMAGAGDRQGSAKFDVENATDEQFRSLSEVEKRKLRGD